MLLSNQMDKLHPVDRWDLKEVLKRQHKKIRDRVQSKCSTSQKCFAVLDYYRSVTWYDDANGRCVPRQHECLCNCCAVAECHKVDSEWSVHCRYNRCLSSECYSDTRCSVLVHRQLPHLTYNRRCIVRLLQTLTPKQRIGRNLINKFQWWKFKEEDNLNYDAIKITEYMSNLQ